MPSIKTMLINASIFKLCNEQVKFYKGMILEQRNCVDIVIAIIVIIFIIIFFTFIITLAIFVEFHMCAKYQTLLGVVCINYLKLSSQSFKVAILSHFQTKKVMFKKLLFKVYSRIWSL